MAVPEAEERNHPTVKVEMKGKKKDEVKEKTKGKNMGVDGNSMRPACHPGDIVFFLRILPDGVGYGDAVILKDASGEYLIKRIAGLPGDVMEVDREGHLTRNGAEVQETDVIYGLSETGDSVDYPYTVPEGSYFFLGDNRPVSLDSRMLGATGREEIKGKVIWAAGAGRWNKKNR